MENAMSASELTQVLAHMPDGYLETCILDSLTKMFAEGDWKLVDSLLPRILELDGRNELKASALTTGVKTVLRQRETGLALERYNLLDMLGGSEPVISARLDALFNLAMYLLPNLMGVAQTANTPKNYNGYTRCNGIEISVVFPLKL